MTTPRPARPEPLIFLFALSACAVLSDAERLRALDVDGDGYDFVDDCDNEDDEVHPGQDDLVGDGVDQNCDGVDGLDIDGDGWASQLTGGDDCDDDDARAYPGAPELCGDGVVNDCEGSNADSQSRCVPSGEQSLARADGVLTGAEPGDGAGAAVAGLDDVNGASSDDIAISSPFATVDGRLNAGRVYLLRGPLRSTPQLVDAALVIEGDQASEVLGASLAGRGDVDGDAYPDLLIGAPGASTDAGTRAGTVFLILQPAEGTLSSLDADAILRGGTAEEFAGQATGMAGDINEDGQTDMLVGSPHHTDGAENAGAVYLLLGPASGELQLADAELVLIGTETAANAGIAVRGGYLNGNGTSDLVIGAPSTFSAAPGAVFIVLDAATSGALAGGTLVLDDADFALSGTSGGDQVGAALALLADVNQDDYPDLLIGAPGVDEGGSDAGAAYLIRGGSGPGWANALGATGTLSVADARVVGAEDAQQAGASVAGLGDIDGDEGSDILIGAPHASEGADGAGVVFLALSPVEGTLSVASLRASLLGDLADDHAGWAVDGAGDVDGNGFSDILIGAPGTAGVSTGRAFLLLSGY